MAIPYRFITKVLMVLLGGASLVMIYLAIDASCDCSVVDEMSRKIRLLRSQVLELETKLSDLKLKQIENEGKETPKETKNGDEQEANGDDEADNLSWGPHKLAVIVPYRDRFEELMEFLPYMHKYLNMQSIRHQFIIVNQIDSHR